MKLWPRTLGMQLVIVTSVAVLASNLVVAVWFEMGRMRLNESAQTERLLDRAASVATLMSSIPPKARQAATHALASNLWQFQIRTGKDAIQPMTVQEAALAARLKAMLPAKSA